MGALLGGIAGAVGGAVVSLVLTTVITARIFTFPKTEDWGSGWVFLIHGLPAVLVGVLGGLLSGWWWATGESGLAWTSAVLTVLAAASIPLPLRLLIYRDKWRIRPRTASERRAWARRITALDEAKGLELARSIRYCWREYGVVVGRRLESACSMYAGDDLRTTEEARAQSRRYQGQDSGWRWKKLTVAGIETVHILPDPLLELRTPAPLFEVRPYSIVRRETPASPGFSTDTTVPRMAALRDCLARLASDAKREGRWDGRGKTFKELLPQRGAADTTSPCGQIFLASHSLNEDEFSLRVIGFDGPVRIVPTNAPGDLPFQIHFFSLGMRYMADETGRWHWREGEWATMSDPAPPAAMFDLTIPLEPPPQS